MVRSPFTKTISLYNLTQEFKLQSIPQPPTIDRLPALTEPEAKALERLRSNYLNLTQRRPLSEEAVKMVVLSPLLDLAGFYQAPFDIETEKSIKISAADEGTIVKGNIDVLVIQEQFWVLVIESKQARFDVMTALPQALAYMLASPNRNQPTFGLLLNGREFVFIRLDRTDIPQYSLSRAFSILNPATDLQDVLQILKYIGEQIAPFNIESPPR